MTDWKRKNHCGDPDCEGWPGCACMKPEFWVEYERKQLQKQQALNVMPQIGPLLDAWEGLPNDMRYDLCEESPAFADAMRIIAQGMEI